MIRYKPSRYNLITENFNGDLLIANLLNSKFIKCGANNIPLVRKILSSNYLSEKEVEIFPSLLNQGFIVLESVDEFKIANFRYHKLVYSNENLELTLIPTEECNFNCIYCYQDDQVFHYMDDECENRILKYIKRNGSNFKAIQIDWFGGEPLLAKRRIISFMEKANKLCKEIKKPLYSFISTNGYALELAAFNELLSHKIIGYQITVDGNRETHNKQRPHKTEDNSYEKIMKNLKDIHNNVKKYYKINIRINLTVSVLSKMNEVIKDLSYFKENNKIQIHWQIVRDYGGEKVHSLDHEMIKDSSTYTSFIDQATAAGIKTMYELYFKFGGALCESTKSNSYYIDFSGNVYKCSLSLYDEETKKDNKIGYINTRGEMIIDDHRQAQWVIRNRPEKKCEDCVYYPLCLSALCPLTRNFKKKKTCLPQINDLPHYMRNMSRRGIFNPVEEE